MKHIVDTAVCDRTVEEVNRIIAENGWTFNYTMLRIGADRRRFHDWQTHFRAPGTYILSGIAKLGGDVNYILTGRHK